ncbi:MAG: diguanylate cyclase, partial [Pseudomonadota bacterium]
MSNSADFRARVDELISVFKVPAVLGELAGHVRAKQLESVESLIPATMLAQLINGTVIMIAFGAVGADRTLALWATVLSFMCGLTMLRFMRSQRQSEKTSASRNSIERVTQAAAISGAVWGITPVIVIPYAGSTGHMVLGIILAAMAFSGAFLMSRIPSAAFAFMVPVLGGLVIGLQLGALPIYDLLSVLILVYGGLLAACVQWAHARHVEQLINEAALKEQEQLISLLLRDFEESTSDWLWQADEEGVISGIPAGFQGQKSQYEMMRPGAALVDLFENCEARDVLLQSVKRRQAFRDLVMPVRGTTGKSWWRLTGKPVFEGGFFAGFRGVASDVTASKETEDRIAHLAHYDALTGLPNRVTLLETLERIVRKQPVMGRQRALLWLDLDNFKWVNDTLGHPAGDELLKMVADRLTEACEQDDTIARLGGDEFAVCIERKGGSAHIEAFVRELAARLAEPYILLGSSARCSASIGVRLLDAYTPDAQTVLQHADLALYKAKSDGRAGWAIFTPDLEAKARRRREIEEDLQRALEKNELLVYFQPQIDANTRKMVGCEALLRWAHPTKGLIYPGHFIETAEDSGLIT